MPATSAHVAVSYRNSTLAVAEVVVEPVVVPIVVAGVVVVPTGVGLIARNVLMVVVTVHGALAEGAYYGAAHGA